MPWQPLPRIAFAIATYPFPASSPADLPLEIGDELYIIEETPDGNWLRGYLVAPPSLLAGLTSVKGQTLEARVFSGIFPRSCVEVREMLGESEHGDSDDVASDGAGDVRSASDSAKSGITGVFEPGKKSFHDKAGKWRRPLRDLPNGVSGNLSLPVMRDPALPRPAAPVPMLKIGDETPTSADEPLIDEIASCLREWHSKNLHELLLSRQYAKLDELSRLVASLNLHRQQFLHNVLTSNEYEQLREKTVWDLVRVNKLCGSEVIVRDPMARGRVLTGDDSVVDVTNLQSVMSLLEEPPLPTVETSTLNHLLMEVKGFAGASTEETGLVIYLVSKPQYGKASSLSEYFTIDIPAGGSINGLAQSSGTRTLFTDLSAQDIGDVPSVDSELYLVVKILASQHIVMPRPVSRSGTNDSNFSKEKPRSPTVGGGKTSRRSLMWGSKSRTAFSRGNGVNKMDSVSEQQENRPSTSRLGSQDSMCRPPSTAGSKSQSGASTEATQAVQRTVGVGVLKLNSIMKQEDEVEQVVNIWSPTPRFPIDRDENEFDGLIRELMTSASGHFERSRRGERMQVSLRKFCYQDADELIKATPTILSGVSQTTRIGFSGAPTKPRSDIYLTLNTAALARQHLLSRYGASPTSIPSTIHGQNLQVTLEVRRSSGERFEKCIFASSNTEGLTTFKSSVAERGEAWNQTLRLSLAAEDVAGAHVVMFLSDMPNPPFAVAHMPLWEDKAFICDGSHGLLLYKIDEFTSTPLPGPSGKVLRQLIFVPEIEVVKLLSDVLDGLFGILVEFSGNDELEDLVFTAIYAETQFNYPFATPCLIRSFTRLLKNPTEPDTARKLRATFKVVRHILKFITQSRNQQKAKEAGIGITSNAQGFTRSLRSIFKALDEMMRSTAPVLIGNQTLAVQHFHTWLPELTGLLTTEEILHIAIDFMDSCIDVKGKLIIYKLILIINYSKLDLFAHPDQRSALSANTVRWISPHWGHTEDVSDQWREQVRLCCSVLSSQIDFLGAEIPDHIPNIVDSYLSILGSPKKATAKLSLLFPSSYPFPTRIMPDESLFDEALAELSAVLSAVSNSPSGLQLELADNDLTSLLENMLRVQMSILVGEAFPSGWLSIHIFHHKSTMRILQYLATIMLDSFLPDPDEAETFNTELWKLFFTTLLKLVGSSSLALETFPEQKRRAVWKIAGDVREHGADLLRRTWEAIGWETSLDELNRYGVSKIGGYQVQYVPTLVGPIVELCLSVHEGLRRMAVEVLQTMIVSEWTLSEDLSVVQMEMIDSLDNYFKSNPLTESSLQKLFVAELLERFQPLSEMPDEPLYVALRELVGMVDEFLDLLVAVHSGDGDGEATNIINRLRLMEFLRDMQKEEIFVRYVHQLANIQAESRNHTEAGLALRLHADLYDWDPIGTTPGLIDPEFPAQSPFERKERIYFDMIKHFEDGESWSNALTAYKELQAQYETNTFDFAKLARTERAIASIYEKIAKTEKIIPKYFRVVYKGLGFPSSVRDKKFVYEGLPNERASAFTDRMQEQYPSAQIITAGDVDELEGQFLVISAITPHRDLSHQVFQRARVPQVIRDFLVSSHPQVFSVTTKRNTAGPVQDHFAEKKLFTTAEPFPTILRRSEIVDCCDLRLSAHETALERIVRKTQEMTLLERRLADGEEHVAQQLMDAVTISVNPASDNSVSKYRKLLPEPLALKDEDDGELEEEIELEPQDTAIKMSLVDHAMMIKRCLALFARSPIDKISRRHQELYGYFKMTYAPEIALFAPPQLAIREPVSTPSTIWRGSMMPYDRGHQWSGIAIPLNGVKAEEAAVIRQVQPRQRATRLSFLGSRRKENDDGSDPVTPLNGRSESVHTLSPGRDNSAPIQKLLRSSSMESGRGEHTSERRGSSGGRVSLDALSRDDVALDKEPGVAKMGSVRKRFSLLKLGMKTTKSNTMVSVDEE
ncbi:Dedicator of cytokinesis protein 1 [Escovopsis weberi]|uniref:Dedicator of cytokinesis protein 1 n=1 Tax=Escovopsis weberi TaxID=150374 RepID=A0A0N0RU55_ESCWE|nr:Dedicator of cytokinesis protein 1 [Escovopsis weberi]